MIDLNVNYIQDRKVILNCKDIRMICLEFVFHFYPDLSTPFQGVPICK